MKNVVKILVWALVLTVFAAVGGWFDGAHLLWGAGIALPLLGLMLFLGKRLSSGDITGGIGSDEPPRPMTGAPAGLLMGILTGVLLLPAFTLIEPEDGWDAGEFISLQAVYRQLMAMHTHERYEEALDPITRARTLERISDTLRAQAEKDHFDCLIGCGRTCPDLAEAGEFFSLACETAATCDLDASVAETWSARVAKDLHVSASIEFLLAGDRWRDAIDRIEFQVKEREFHAQSTPWSLPFDSWLCQACEQSVLGAPGPAETIARVDEFLARVKQHGGDVQLLIEARQAAVAAMRGARLAKTRGRRARLRDQGLWLEASTYVSERMSEEPEPWDLPYREWLASDLRAWLTSAEDPASTRFAAWLVGGRSTTASPRSRRGPGGSGSPTPRWAASAIESSPKTIGSSPPLPGTPSSIGSRPGEPILRASIPSTRGWSGVPARSWGL